MPLQLPEIQRPAPDPLRQEIEARCEAARREYGAKEMMGQALLVIMVLMAILAIAWSLWHG